MFKHSWLRHVARKLGLFSIVRGSATSRARSMLGVSELEGRATPALASFSSLTGTLTIDMNQDNTAMAVRIEQTGGRVGVYVNRLGQSPGFTPILGAPQGGIVPATVRKIEVNGSDRGETINLEDVRSQLGFVAPLDASTPFAVVHGGGGADKITGTEFRDELRGGDGNDTISGRGGNDFIYGGRNNDKMYGGDGHDRIYGGHGSDVAYGQDDGDRFWGGDGIDKFYGGFGNDRFEDRENGEVFEQ